MGAHTEQQLIDAFELMWNTYPEPVRLISKDEIVIAGNAAYLATGGVIGSRCRDQGAPELHKGCKMHKALKSGEAQIKESDVYGVHWTAFWLPIPGEDEYVVHFTNGILETYAKMAAAQAGEAAAE